MQRLHTKTHKIRLTVNGCMNFNWAADVEERQMIDVTEKKNRAGPMRRAEMANLRAALAGQEDKPTPQTVHYLTQDRGFYLIDDQLTASSPAMML